MGGGGFLSIFHSPREGSSVSLLRLESEDTTHAFHSCNYGVWIATKETFLCR